MIVTVHRHDAAKAGQFYETARYILAPASAETREAIRHGQLDPATIGNRVAWARTLNLPTGPATPSGVAAAMSDVVARANELKRAAWEADPKNAGKPFRSGRPPTAFAGMHITLSWHTSENPDRAAQIDAVYSFLKSQGIDPQRHQILIAAHNDSNHAHVHLLVNGVSFRDGHRYDPGKRNWYGIEEWADQYERDRGQNFCPDRREKIEARQRSRREKTDKTHDIEGAPKPAAAPKKDRPPRQSWALKKALDQAKRAGVKLDDRAREEIATLAAKHSAQWATAAELYKASNTLAKAEKDKSFRLSKAEQKAANVTARATLTRGLMGWLFCKIADRADRMDWSNYKAAKSGRWRTFRTHERHNARAALRYLAQEAQRRRVPFDRAELKKSPAAREALMREIDLHDRQRIYDRQRQRRAPINALAAQIVQQSRAAHKARCIEIDKATHDRRAEQRRSFAAAQRKEVTALIENLKERHSVRQIIREKADSRRAAAGRNTIEALTKKAIQQRMDKLAVTPPQERPTGDNLAQPVERIGPLKSTDEIVKRLRYVPLAQRDESTLTAEQIGAVYEARWRRDQGEKITAEELLGRDPKTGRRRPYIPPPEEPDPEKKRGATDAVKARFTDAGRDRSR